MDDAAAGRAYLMGATVDQCLNIDGGCHCGSVSPLALPKAPIVQRITGRWHDPAAAALCEATAARTPVIAVPMLNDTLARHPAWQHSTELLTGCGWRWIPLDGTPEIQTSPKPISSGVGEQLADAFRVDQLADLIVSEPVL